MEMSCWNEGVCTSYEVQMVPTFDIFKHNLPGDTKQNVWTESTWVLVKNAVLNYSKGASFTLDRSDMFCIIIITVITIIIIPFCFVFIIPQVIFCVHFLLLCFSKDTDKSRKNKKVFEK